MRRFQYSVAAEVTRLKLQDNQQFQKAAMAAIRQRLPMKAIPEDRQKNKGQKDECLNHPVFLPPVFLPETSHASVRLQSHCMVMGQGVGTCAALALNAGMDMAKLDVRKLQAQLRRDAAYLENVPEYK